MANSFEQPKTSTELDPLPHGYSRQQIAAATSPLVQELILLPTEKCNFRCTYCYEDFELGKMSDSTQAGIEKYLERRIPGLKKLVLSWFGGEPLVAKDVVFRISQYAKNLCDTYGVAFEGNLTTNAYLLNAATFDRLIALNQNFFQITLDGWEEAHDVLRKRKDGAGTFTRIWNNLIEMRKNDGAFEILVRLHVRPTNLENLRILIREFAREFRGDERFRLDYQHLRDMGGEGGKTVGTVTTMEELSNIKTALNKIYFDELAALGGTLPTAPNTVNAVTVGNQVTDHTSLMSMTAGESAGSRRSGDSNAAEPYICYAAKPNSLLIRANGRLGKCTVAFNDERNDLGHIDGEGLLHIDNNKLRPWFQGIQTLDVEATACPVWKIPSPVAIKSDKHIIPIVAA